MQKKAYLWFLNNYEAIYKKYGKGFVVVKSQKVIGSYKTYHDALIKTIKDNKIGSFIIQECVSDKIESTYCIIPTIL